MAFFVALFLRNNRSATRDDEQDGAARESLVDQHGRTLVLVAHRLKGGGGGNDPMDPRVKPEGDGVGAGRNLETSQSSWPGLDPAIQP